MEEIEYLKKALLEAEGSNAWLRNAREEAINESFSAYSQLKAFKELVSQARIARIEYQRTKPTERTMEQFLKMSDLESLVDKELRPLQPPSPEAGE